jgi:hypothetical protein
MLIVKAFGALQLFLGDAQYQEVVIAVVRVLFPAECSVRNGKQLVSESQEAPLGHRHIAHLTVPAIQDHVLDFANFLSLIVLNVHPN